MARARDALDRAAMVAKQVPDMTAEVAKIDELVEKVSIEELPAAKEAAKKNRGLPAKYLLKQFFASFKEYRELPQRFRDVKLETLVQGLHEVRKWCGVEETHTESECVCVCICVLRS